jgi:NADH-quinone oxidoreductase subunit J
VTATDITLALLGLAAVLSGWRVFATDSMVRASFLLLLSFVATALMMLLLAADYIGVATIFMMAVEMTVMALFMVMFMMNPAGLNPMSMVHQHRFSIGAGAAAFAAIAAVALWTDFPSNPVAADAAAIHDLGIELLGPSMLIFETAGVALLATMIGTVILSSRAGRFGPADAESMPPPLEPGGEPAGRMPKQKQKGHGGHGGHGGHSEHGEHGGRGGHGGHGA